MKATIKQITKENIRRIQRIALDTPTMTAKERRWIIDSMVQEEFGFSPIDILMTRSGYKMQKESIGKKIEKAENLRRINNVLRNIKDNSRMDFTI